MNSEDNMYSITNSNLTYLGPSSAQGEWQLPAQVPSLGSQNQGRDTREVQCTIMEARVFKMKIMTFNIIKVTITLIKIRAKVMG